MTPALHLHFRCHDGVRLLGGERCDGQGEGRGEAQADAQGAAVEYELMFLNRALEALQRKRSYPLERAEFLILRTLSEGGAATVGGLAKALLLDDSTMTR